MKQTVPGATAKPTILIVDDEPDLVSTIRDFFGLMGFETAEAANGVEALIQLQRASFDIVMTDLKMPELSGQELLRKVSSAYPTIPVIILTGHGTIENAVQAMRDGAYDFLTKPVNLDRLSLLVKRALSN